MGWNYHDISTLPEQYDIVWCKWPQREDKLLPGKTVRPVLVRETELREFVDGTQFGMALVSYASGEGIDDISRQRDLIIEAHECRAVGLHKATRFSLNPRDRKWLPWSDEYFVPQEYVINAGLVAGSLNPSQMGRLHAALKHRGLVA
jgi:hypothetical protein